MAMEFTGEQLIDAPIAKVWAALNDLDVLKACIPGCQELTQAGEDQLTAITVLKIGPIKARFTGEITFQEKMEPELFVMQGEGKGGVAGFAKGRARITLATTAEGATLLGYQASVDISGKIAQLGARLIPKARSYARKLGVWACRFAWGVASCAARSGRGAVPPFSKGEKISRK
jgi:uncharacterized protein